MVEKVGSFFLLADAGFVILCEGDDSERMKVRASFGYGSVINDVQVNVDPKLGGAPGRTFAAKKPVLAMGREAVASIVAQMDPEAQALIRKAIAGRPLGSSVMCAPFFVRDRFLGGIQLEHWRDLSLTFTPEDLYLLHILCEYIAIAIDNAMLYRELQSKERIARDLLAKVIRVQEEERQRIARELHDEINQMLTGLHLGLQSLKGCLAPDCPEISDKISRLQEIADEATSRTHCLAYGLRPSLLDDLGLPMALDWYVRVYLAGSSIPIRLKVKLDRRLTPEAETVLFRVAQESLANAIKYSQASQITVCLYEIQRGSQKVVRLVIADNGRGFDTRTTCDSVGSSRCLGLRGMAERVSLIGGRLDIRSRPGVGTCIIAEIEGNGGR